METPTIEELRRWSTELIGWQLAKCDCCLRDKEFYFMMSKEDWRPDDPDTGQIWMVIDKMRELGFTLSLGYGDTVQGILGWARFESESYKSYHPDPNPCLAILLAAWRAMH